MLNVFPPAPPFFKVDDSAMWPSGFRKDGRLFIPVEALPDLTPTLKEGGAGGERYYIVT